MLTIDLVGLPQSEQGNPDFVEVAEKPGVSQIGQIDFTFSISFSVA